MNVRKAIHYEIGPAISDLFYEAVPTSANLPNDCMYAKYEYEHENAAAIVGIAFGFEMSRLYPDIYIPIYDYRIIIDDKKRFIYTLHKRIDFVDIDSENRDYVNAQIAQIGYLNRLRGYVLGYAYNAIAAVATSEEYINIMGWNVQSYGQRIIVYNYYYVASIKLSHIFGTMSSATYSSSGEHATILGKLCTAQSYNKNKIRMNDIIPILMRKYPLDITVYPRNYSLTFYLYQVLNSKAVSDVLGAQVSSNIKASIEDIKFLAQNWDNYEALALYFLSKLPTTAAKPTNPYRLDNFTCGKLIGEGVNGSVYEAIPKMPVEQKCVIKIEKALIGDGHIENMFAFDLGTAYSENFTTLYDYENIYNCDYKNNYDNYWFTRINSIDRQNQQNSRMCIRRLYSYAEYDLADFRYESKQQLYSLIVQYLNAAVASIARGYIDNGMYVEDIRIDKTTEERIHLYPLDKVVPTHGVFCKIIDYGEVRNFWFKDINAIKNMAPHVKELAKHIKLYAFMNQRSELDQRKITGMVDVTKAFKRAKIPFRANPPNWLIDYEILITINPDIWFEIIYMEAKPIGFTITPMLAIEDMQFYAENWTNIKKLFNYFCSKLVN